MPKTQGPVNAQDRGERRIGMVMALPASVWLALFTIIPLLVLTVYSLFETDKFQIKGSLTLANYLVLFESPVYIKLIGKTVAVALTTAVVCLVLGFPVSYYLAFRGQRRVGFLLALTILPYLAGYIPRVLALRAMLGTNGVINWVLTRTGLLKEPIHWLVFSNFGTVVGLVYAWLPIMIVLIYLSLERIHPTVIEAAHDLGADSAHTLRTVILPLARPGIMGGFLLVFLPTIGAMIEPSLMGGASGTLIGNVIAQRFITVMDWSRGSSLAMLLVMILLLIAYVLRRVGGGVSEDEI